MKFLILHLAYLLFALLIQHVILANGSTIGISLKNGFGKKDAAKKEVAKTRTKVQNPLKRMGKLNLVRATMPVLAEAPKFTKEELQKMQDAENNATFGGPISGKIKQSETAGKVAIGVRIIRGSSTTRGEFPWQVGMIVDDENFCGGSLISPNHVLTAAHCVYKQKTYELVFGAQNRSADEEGMISMTSTKAVAHRGYNENTLKNDIAIIFLPRPVQESDYIRMIKLPKRIRANKFMKKGVPVNVAGWGRTTDKSLDISDNLKTIKLSIMNSVDCVKAFGKTSYGPTNLCALGKNGDATCQGDSGGALIYKNPSDGSHTQIGIVSYGAAEGCESGYPEVFTKVANYLGWISAQTGLSV